MKTKKASKAKTAGRSDGGISGMEEDDGPADMLVILGLVEDECTSPEAALGVCLCCKAELVVLDRDSLSVSLRFWDSEQDRRVLVCEACRLPIQELCERGVPVHLGTLRKTLRATRETVFDAYDMALQATKRADIEVE